MVNDVTLTINGLDLRGRLSTYSVSQDVEWKKVITTLDGVEHPYPGVIRPEIEFTLVPGTDDEDSELYNVLSNLIVNVLFTKNGADVEKRMRVTSDFESNFLLKSVDGKRRYKSGKFVLRGL